MSLIFFQYQILFKQIIDSVYKLKHLQKIYKKTMKRKRKKKKLKKSIYPIIQDEGLQKSVNIHNGKCLLNYVQCSSKEKKKKLSEQTKHLLVEAKEIMVMSLHNHIFLIKKVYHIFYTFCFSQEFLFFFFEIVKITVLKTFSKNIILLFF